MLLQFRLAYKHEDVLGTRWVMEAREIASHYLFSFWFPLDLFSVLTSLFDLVGGEDTQNLIALRAVRTLRLIKLIKLARGSRIFKRWEMAISINYDYLTLSCVLVGILLVCHWTACVWGLQATFDPLNSWPGAKSYCESWEAYHADGIEQPCVPDPSSPLVGTPVTCDKGKCDDMNVCEGGLMCAAWFEMYTYSLYFSVMTITSVGYGDVSATAFNVGEQWVCTIIMLLSGMLWGYLVGVFCTLAASSPSVQAFRDELSQLNSFMHAYNLSSSLRIRLREFMHETVHLRQTESRAQLLSKLSPAMQGEVSLLVNQRWVSKVWYLREGAQLELLIEIASRLKPQVFGPWEFCPCGLMYIVNRGTALYAARPCSPGSVWGDDVLLNHPPLQLDFAAIAISYLWVFTIDGAKLVAAINKFPESAERLRKVARRWLIRRAIVRQAERSMHSQGRQFRGRHSPIYAKEVAVVIKTRRISLQPSPMVRASRLSRFSKLSNFSGRVSERISARWSSSSGQRTPKAARSPFRGKRTLQRQKSPGGLSGAAKAAQNFGLQLREEQLRSAKNENEDVGERISELSSEMAMLRKDMQAVLRALNIPKPLSNSFRKSSAQFATAPITKAPVTELPSVEPLSRAGVDHLEVPS